MYEHDRSYRLLYLYSAKIKNKNQMNGKFNKNTNNIKLDNKGPQMLIK